MRRAAFLLLALAGVAGCNDECADSCSPPVFDLTMGRVQDLALSHDLAITSAGVVMVGAGAANAFSPSTVTIQAGQSVTWNWVSGFHSVVSDSTPKAFADSAAQSAGLAASPSRADCHRTSTRSRAFSPRSSLP